MKTGRCHYQHRRCWVLSGMHSVPWLWCSDCGAITVDATVQETETRR
jgi:hypothetical protein